MVRKVIFSVALASLLAGLGCLQHSQGRRQRYRVRSARQDQKPSTIVDVAETLAALAKQPSMRLYGVLVGHPCHEVRNVAAARGLFLVATPPASLVAVAQALAR